MKMVINSTIRNKKAVTLMEIVLAVFILAFTFIPIIGTLVKSTKDTDVFNSYVFAQTTARNILDTILDDVPFHSIQNSGSNNIAKLVDSTVYDFSMHQNKTYKVEKIMEMFGSKAKSGNAQGVLEDKNRGIKYDVTLYVFPIEASSNGTNSNDEIKFTYRPRPNFGNGEINWYTYTNQDGSQYRKSDSVNPYSDEVEEKELNAFKLGVKQHPKDNYCVMKKLVLTIEWKGYDEHSKEEGKRKLSIFTMKANLDSEKP